MPTLSITLSEAEYKALNGYATANGLPMDEAVKRAFFDMLEDRDDSATFDRAYAKYRKDPKTYSSEEVEKELGIH